MMKPILIVLISLLPGMAVGQETLRPLNETKEMKTYWMVFMKKGPNRNQDSVTAERIQKEHLLFLSRMYHEGHALMLGPITDDTEIRGIVVYGTSTSEEARNFAEQDPAVKAGRLIIEVHPWSPLRARR